MTPANENAVRATCALPEEMRRAMRKKPKPNWNKTVTIINKHHKKIEALGVSLLEFVVCTGAANRRFRVVGRQFDSSGAKLTSKHSQIH
ncbi:hypothetical protein ACVXG7_10160 [Enterobacter hormaechei]